jgi:hypothetical protein
MRAKQIGDESLVPRLVPRPTDKVVNPNLCQELLTTQGNNACQSPLESGDGRNLGNSGDARLVVGSTAGDEDVGERSSRAGLRPRRNSGRLGRHSQKSPFLSTTTPDDAKPAPQWIVETCAEPCESLRLRVTGAGWQGPISFLTSLSQTKAAFSKSLPRLGTRPGLPAQHIQAAGKRPLCKWPLAVDC